MNIIWIVTTQWRAQACGYAGAPKILENHCVRLPLVKRKNHRTVVGYRGRTANLEVRLHRLQRPRREPGWLTRNRGDSSNAAPAQAK